MGRSEFLVHLQATCVGADFKHCHRFRICSRPFLWCIYAPEQRGIFVSFLCLKISTKFEVYIRRDV